MRDFAVSMGRADNLAAITKVARTSWPKFAAFLTREPPVTEDKASVGWYCPAEFDPVYRDGKNLIARHCLAFDYDDIDEFDFEDIRATYKPYAYVAYTTSSHTPDKPRLRVVMPLSRPATAQEFGAVTRKIGAQFDLEKLARESDKPAQMMFLPSRKPAGVFWSEINNGKWVDVDGVLDEYDDWRDRREWPQRRSGDYASDAGAVAPPDTKEGVVGDFCRSFRIPEAIERFNLPYVRGTSDGRYTYTSGSRPDGARLYDNGLKLHSEHNTDPAHGQHNAFDLVRLHRFGALDSPDDLSKPVTQRPSFKAMAELALAQPEVQEGRIAGEFEDLDEAEGQPADNTSSKSDKKGPAVPAVRFKLWSLEELAQEPPAEWLVKGLVPRADLVVVYGPPGSGKSFFSYDLACAIERGMPWGDAKLRVRKGRTVYVFAEGGSGARNRGLAYCQKYGEGAVPLAIRERPNMFDEADTAALTKAILDQGGADLIVVDTLNAASPGADENSGKDMTKVLGHCRFLRDKTGATVVLIHHSGKDESRGARGWSGLKGAADAEICIRRDDNLRTAVVTKMKEGPDGGQYSFKLMVAPVGEDADGDPMTSCYVEHVAAEIRRPRDAPRGMYQEIVMDVVKKYGTADTQVVIDESVERIPKTDAGKRDTREQNIKRAIRLLVKDGLIYKKGLEVSVTSAVEVDDE